MYEVLQTGKKIKCPSRKRGTHNRIHLLSVQVTTGKYWENAPDIKDHQALAQANYQFLEFRGAKEFKIDQKIPI